MDISTAYRANRRWVQTFEAIHLNDGSTNKICLREGGVYLITGGLGGIGLALAEYLAKTVRAKLILIGRRSLPERSQWSQWLATHDSQDAVSCKLQKILAIEELGAQVYVKSADVANAEQVELVISQISNQFGQINGVIHSAGIAGGGIVQLKTPDIANSVLAPKVKGTLVLEEALKNINLDFFLLCSSLSSILGGFGQVDYCAANSFLDAIAHRHASKYDRLAISINWDAWQEVGMAVETTIPELLKKGREENIQRGILPFEGADAFSRILRSRIPQIVISTQDLQTVIEQERSFKSRSLQEKFALLEGKLEQANLSRSTYSRPKLGNDYVAPRNEVQRTIANIWQQSLGIEQVGIHDDFFELGGDSLTAIQIISRLRKEFQIELPLHHFFERPTTVAGLAERVEAIRLTLIQALGSPIAAKEGRKEIEL